VSNIIIFSLAILISPNFSLNAADYAPIDAKLPRIYQKTKGYIDFVIVGFIAPDGAGGG
jgi:hypothetical protein